MNQQDRITQAWILCHSWITHFDGAATEAFLPDLLFLHLEQAITTLVQDSSHFRIEPIWRESPLDENTLYEIPTFLQLLSTGRIVSLQLIYQIVIEQDAISITILLDPGQNEQFDAEIIWWSDQVFPPNTEHEVRFQLICLHFFKLQSLFRSTSMYVAPETLTKPYEDQTVWIEI